MFSFQVNSNGALYFGPPFDLTITDRFPYFPENIIAPFFSDVNTETAGEVYFRFTSDPLLREQVDSLVPMFFLDSNVFNSLQLFIATWDRVAEFNGRNDSVSTLVRLLKLY